MSTGTPEPSPGNLYQAATTEEKLRGKYYTPPELVGLVLERMAPHPGDTLLDPSCGDGEFLVGGAHALLDQGQVTDAHTLIQRLVGFDVNPVAVSEARARLAAVLQERLGTRVDPDSVRIYCINALEYPDRAALAARLGEVPGRLLIVGNPPYVEAKRLANETKSWLKQRYPSAASGAPDLFLYFLHACLDWLLPQDRLALVLPNRILVNTSAKALRERLLSRQHLWGIDFATRTQIFPGAAVYPVVLYAAATPDENHTVRLASIQRQAESLVRTPLRPLSTSRYGATDSRAFFPTPETAVLAESLERLVAALEQSRLVDVLDIRWSVSFHRRGLRERFVRQSQEGMAYPERFLGGGTFAGNGDISRYRARWSGWWIDYDDQTLRREHNQLPPLELFRRPKIAICQNGRTVRAAFDDQGFVLKDTLLCGVLREADHPLCRYPRALVGLLCSGVVHFYYSHLFHGGHMNGGYLHFLRTFLNDIPLGQWSDEGAAEVESLVRQREELVNGSDTEAVEEEIEARVAAAFGLEREQGDAIRQWADADENWRFRDRVRRSGRQSNGEEIAYNPSAP